MGSEKNDVSRHVNPVEFILEVEKWSAIWDPTQDDYSNKNVKKKAWEAIIGNFVADFAAMSPAEKNFIAISFQRKWKSLRDSYAREKAKQRKEIESGITTKCRKQYIFFEQLRFLDVINHSKQTDDSLPRTDDEENGDDSSKKAEDSATKGEEIRGKGKDKRKNRDWDSDPLKHLVKSRHRREVELKMTDDDKLFLLSLHNDLKSLPDPVKLNVKCQMLGLLSSAKQLALATASTSQHLPPSIFQLLQQTPTQMQSVQYPQPIPPYPESERNPEIVLTHDPSYYLAPQSPEEATSNASTSDVSTEMFT